MQRLPSCSRASLRGSHLDSATYRAIFRLLSYCVQLQSQLRPDSCVSPSPPARGDASVYSGDRRRSGSVEEEKEKAGGDGIVSIATLDNPLGVPDEKRPIEEELEQVEDANRRKPGPDCSTSVPPPEETKLSTSREISLSANAEELREDGRNDETVIDESNFQQSVNTCPLASGSGLEEFSEGNLAAHTDAVPHNEIEEGEISGDFGVSDTSVDLESGDEAAPQGERISSPRISIPGDSNSAEIPEKKDEIQREETASEVKIGEVRGKRKKGPLTESRKEKKKLAKKRKRAETNKKLGVKRLKLDMMPKTKKVLSCNFYQKGRCHKGGTCKFSHDLIPDTKSTPCSFFARGTCLKGSDCPFDHELSKYPCHNFASEGWCIRGENCRFSHKISSAELPSAPPTGQKETPQKPLTMTSSDAKFSGFKTPSTKIPKGLSFLSFAKELPVSDGGLMKGRKLTLSEKSTPAISLYVDKSLGPPEKNVTLEKKNVEISQDDASRLLEEFLFSGADISKSTVWNPLLKKAQTTPFRMGYLNG